MDGVTRILTQTSTRLHRAEVDDVADVEVAPDTVGVDHDEATGVIDVDGSGIERVGTTGQLDANRPPERDQRVAVLPGDDARQGVEFLEDCHQHGEQG